jgi:hypothetical protein
MLAKAHTRDSTQALQADHGRRWAGGGSSATPRWSSRIEELFADVQAGEVYEQIAAVLGKYRRTLQSDRRHMLEQFTLVRWPARSSAWAASAPAPGSC